MPNSSYKLILVKMRAEYFCDLVHVRGVVDPFAEQLVVPAQKRQNAGGITDVRALYGQFFTNIVYTGVPV